MFTHSPDIDIWLLPPLGLLWTLLQWTWMCTYLFEVLFSILLDAHSEVALLNHKVILFLTLWGTSMLFSVIAEPFYIPTNSIQLFHFSTSLSAFVIFCVLDSGHLMNVKWYLMVVLICILLMISDPEHLFICFFGHLYIFFGENSVHSFAHFFPNSYLKYFIQFYTVSDSFVTSWTVANQAPLSMGFSRQEYWSGLPFPSLTLCLQVITKYLLYFLVLYNTSL